MPRQIPKVAIGLSEKLTVIVSPEIAEKFPNPEVMFLSGTQFQIRNSGKPRPWANHMDGKTRRLQFNLSQIKGNVPAKRFGNTFCTPGEYQFDGAKRVLFVEIPKEKKRVRVVKGKNPVGNLPVGVSRLLSDVEKRDSPSRINQIEAAPYGDQRKETRRILRRNMMLPENELRVSDLKALVSKLNQYKKKFGSDLDFKIREDGGISAALMMSFGEDDDV